ncbi:homeobox KN domain-containing protein [Trichoderma gracile]
MAVFSDLAPMHRRPVEYSPDMRQPRAMAICHPPTSEFSFALPSVKEMFPELTSGTWSPPNGSTAQPVSPRDVPSSPGNRRRRPADEVDEEETHRPRTVPRVHRDPMQRVSRSPQSPSSTSWSSGGWTTTPATAVSPTSSFAKPAPMEVQERSPAVRFALPFPLPSQPGAHHSEVSPSKAQEWPRHYSHDYTHHHRAQYHPDSDRSESREATRAYSMDYTHWHNHHTYQSQPTSPRLPYDPARYSAGVYPAPHHMEPNLYGESGATSGGGARPRRRRGNLPKETTDQLRAWLNAHLHHPYPTEDEKQQLMRTTGLQMNQISNWFINARRRQVPSLLRERNAEIVDPNRMITSPNRRSRSSSISDGDLSSSEWGPDAQAQGDWAARRRSRSV